jgi:hypothetical protein
MAAAMGLHEHVLGEAAEFRSRNIRPELSVVTELMNLRQIRVAVLENQTVAARLAFSICAATSSVRVAWRPARCRLLLVAGPASNRLSL